MQAIVTGLPNNLSEAEQLRYGRTLLVGMWAEGLPIQGVQVNFEEEKDNDVLDPQ